MANQQIVRPEELPLATIPPTATINGLRSVSNNNFDKLKAQMGSVWTVLDNLTINIGEIGIPTELGSIETHTDVDLNTVLAGQVLSFDGIRWTNTTLSTVVDKSLPELTDVTVSGAAERDFLIYDSNTNEWVNGRVTFDDLGISGNGFSLVYRDALNNWLPLPLTVPAEGTNFIGVSPGGVVSKAINLDDMGDVDNTLAKTNTRLYRYRQNDTSSKLDVIQGHESTRYQIEANDGLYVPSTAQHITFDELVIDGPIEVDGRLVINDYDGAPLAFSALTGVDVISTPPSTGDALVYDGNNWVPGSGSASSLANPFGRYRIEANKTIGGDAYGLAIFSTTPAANDPVISLRYTSADSNGHDILLGVSASELLATPSKPFIAIRQDLGLTIIQGIGLKVENLDNGVSKQWTTPRLMMVGLDGDFPEDLSNTYGVNYFSTPVSSPTVTNIRFDESAMEPKVVGSQSSPNTSSAFTLTEASPMSSFGQRGKVLFFSQTAAKPTVTPPMGETIIEVGNWWDWEPAPAVNQWSLYRASDTLIIKTYLGQVDGGGATAVPPSDVFELQPDVITVSGASRNITEADGNALFVVDSGSGLSTLTINAPAGTKDYIVRVLYKSGGNDLLLRITNDLTVQSTPYAIEETPAANGGFNEYTITEIGKMYTLLIDQVNEEVFVLDKKIEDFTGAYLPATLTKTSTTVTFTDTIETYGGDLALTGAFTLDLSAQSAKEAVGKGAMVYYYGATPFDYSIAPGSKALVMEDGLAGISDMTTLHSTSQVNIVALTVNPSGNGSSLYDYQVTLRHVGYKNALKDENGDEVLIWNPSTNYTTALSVVDLGATVQGLSLSAWGTSGSQALNVIETTDDVELILEWLEAPNGSTGIGFMEPGVPTHTVVGSLMSAYLTTGGNVFLYDQNDDDPGNHQNDAPLATFDPVSFDWTQDVLVMKLQGTTFSIFRRRGVTDGPAYSATVDRVQVLPYVVNRATSQVSPRLKRI